MTKPVVRHRAGNATYPGDVRSIVGEVKGPTNFGTMLIAIAAHYDETADSTRVAFVVAHKDDAAQFMRDEWGIWRLPTMAGVS